MTEDFKVVMKLQPFTLIGKPLYIKILLRFL